MTGLITAPNKLGLALTQRVIPSPPGAVFSRGIYPSEFDFPETGILRRIPLPLIKKDRLPWDKSADWLALNYWYLRWSRTGSIPQSPGHCVISISLEGWNWTVPSSPFRLHWTPKTGHKIKNTSRTIYQYGRCLRFQAWNFRTPAASAPSPVLGWGYITKHARRRALRAPGVFLLPGTWDRHSSPLKFI